MKIVRRLILAAIVLFMAAGGIIYYHIEFFAHYAQPVKSDVIIVLGCKVNGEKPSLSLEYRLDRALELYGEGYGRKIIVSGGQGSNEAMPEARVMKNWLLKHHVGEADILEEDQSTSTYENLKFSRRIMLQENLKTAVIVSNDFHIFRSLFLSGRLGMSCSASPAPEVAYQRLYFRSREVLSVVKSFLLDR